MRTFERYCKNCPTVFTPTGNGGSLCPACRPTPKPKVNLSRIKPCFHCGVSFTWKGAQKYCRDCKPDNGQRTNQLMSMYGLARPEYDAMYFEQDGLCAICQIWEATHVDHDHKCCTTPGKSCGRCIRGLLCGGCNLNVVIWETEGANMLLAPFTAARYLILTGSIVRRRLYGPRVDGSPEPWGPDSHGG